MPKCKDSGCTQRNAVLSEFCAAHTTEPPPAFFAIEWGMGGTPALNIYDMFLAGTVFAFRTEAERDRFVNAKRPDVNNSNSGAGVRQAIPAISRLGALPNAPNRTTE